MKKNKEIKNLHRHLKRIASNNARPILNSVHYCDDGSITVNDSRRLLKINGFHGHKEMFNINIATMKIVEGQYPDITSLIPKSFNTEITISLAVLLRVMKALETRDSDYEYVLWNLCSDKIIFTNSTDEFFYGEPVKITATATVKGDLLNISLNTKYVKECCEFFIDTKDRYANDDVKIKICHDLEPVKFTTNEAKYVYLIMPQWY